MARTTALNNSFGIWKRSWRPLGLEKIIPVGHDAGGPTAVNFALKHPERAAAERVLRRSPWTTSSRVYRALREQKPEISHPFLASPQQFAWLLAFQRDQTQVGLTEEQKARYTQFLGPIIDNNFRQRPSAGPAFAQMTYQYSDEIAANTAHLDDFRRCDVRLLLIWGKSDPYLHVTVAEYMRFSGQECCASCPRSGALAPDRRAC